MNQEEKALLEAFAESEPSGHVAIMAMNNAKILRILVKWVLSKQPKKKKEEDN